MQSFSNLSNFIKKYLIICSGINSYFNLRHYLGLFNLLKKFLFCKKSCFARGGAVAVAGFRLDMLRNFSVPLVSVQWEAATLHL